MYVESISERDSWVAKLRHAAKSRNITEFYKIKGKIGTGKFSQVHLATELATGDTYAVKIVDKRQLNLQEKDMLRSELAILKLLHHPNVVFLKDIFDTKTHIYIAMEYVQGGELFTYIKNNKKLSEYAAK